MEKFINLGSGLTEEYRKYLLNLLELLVSENRENVGSYVDDLMRSHHGLGRDALARKIIGRLSFKSSATGAVLGLGGPILSGISLPAELKNTFKIQADLIMAIAHLYGRDIGNVGMVTDILLLLAGDGGPEALRKSGVTFNGEFTEKAVRKFLKKDIMSKAQDIISRAIIKKIGATLSVKSFKAAALAGISMGAIFDYFGTRRTGMRALTYYSGTGNMEIRISNISDFVKGKFSLLRSVRVDDDSIILKFSLLNNVLKGEVKLEYLGFIEGSLLFQIKGNFIMVRMLSKIRDSYLKDARGNIDISDRGILSVHVSRLLQREIPGLAGVEIMDIRVSGGEVIIEV